MTDLWLAVAHHVAALTLACLLAAEAALVRPGISGGELTRVARIDAAYGATAGLLLTVGLLRIFFGAKGNLYFIENVWFWAKLTAFLAMGMCSLPPTLRFLKWRKLQRVNPGFQAPPDEIKRVQAFVRVQLLLLLPIAGFAATMARYVGL